MVGMTEGVKYFAVSNTGVLKRALSNNSLTLRVNNSKNNYQHHHYLKLCKL